MALVQIYTTQVCPYCHAAKAIFDRKSVPYEEIDVSRDQEKRQWLAKVSGQRTVPQIFIDEKSYGGFTEIAALDKRGELDPLLA